MSAFNDSEEIATLRAALAAATTELATMKVQFGDEASKKAQRAAAAQRTTLEAVIEQSAKELSRLDESVDAAIASLRAVAAVSVLELPNGFVTSREESVLEVRRLAGIIGDTALAAARKSHQHEALKFRFTGFAPPVAPKPTSFEASYYDQPHEKEPVETA
jgi:hypothetical protein